MIDAYAIVCFQVIKLSSIDKIARHIDQRQITLDLSGLLNYTHEDWLKLRSVSMSTYMFERVGLLLLSGAHEKKK